MRRIFSNLKFRFFAKATVAHLVTYIACGLVAFNLFHYGDFVESLGFRPMEEISMAMVVITQIVRGVLYGFAVWWMRDSVIGKKRGWLRLWGILVILGIFDTYGPALGSIEGMLFLDPSRFGDVPVNGLLSFAEILVQPLLFSIIVTFQGRKKSAA